MKAFDLVILTPVGAVFSQAVYSLVVPGVEGRLGVLAGHAPMIVGLQSGLLNAVGSDGRWSWKSGPGLAEIKPGSVTVMVDELEKMAAPKPG